MRNYFKSNFYVRIYIYIKAPLKESTKKFNKTGKFNTRHDISFPLTICLLRKYLYIIKTVVSGQ